MGQGTVEALVAEFFAANPGVTLAALGPRDNLRALDDRPWGVRAELLPAESHAELCEQYVRLNHHAFGKLPLPRWVFSDLYLLPGAIGLLLGPATMLETEALRASGLRERDRAILATWVGAPSVLPGCFVGVSLMSFAHGIGAGRWVKALTLRMLRARSVRGVAQWDNPSVRVHARLGALRIVGRVPGGHELSDRTFVYECHLEDEHALGRALRGDVSEPPTDRIRPDDHEALRRILDAAERSEHWRLIPPGRDDSGLLTFARGP